MELRDRFLSESGNGLVYFRVLGGFIVFRGYLYNRFRVSVLVFAVLLVFFFYRAFRGRMGLVFLICR